MRAFNLVVHLIGERGGHKTVPNLKIKKANKQDLRHLIRAS